MDQSSDTIVALSSGALPSGVAVIRLSGPHALQLVTAMAGDITEPRKAYLRKLVNPETGEVLDICLVMTFPGPNSFTGEDIAELHLHGGRAVVEGVLDYLTGIEGVRLAEAGEFSRRAFENGRMDLTEVEGLSDLISADTEAQRRLAISQSGGALRQRLENWRQEIVRCRALIEAELDFADEEDVPGSVSDQVWSRVSGLRSELASFLEDNNAGEIIRDGYRVVLMGAPNAGKSSLLNALAKRDVAIVSEEAGTTRDLIEVHLNISGMEVIVTDTAGIRDTKSKVESEGIKRAREAGNRADLILWLVPVGEVVPDDLLDNAVLVRSKADDAGVGLPIGSDLQISVKSENGLDMLLRYLKGEIGKVMQDIGSGIVTRKRHRDLIEITKQELDLAVKTGMSDITMGSEHLRRAGDSVGKISGRIDIEDLLDVIFSEFCIGK